MPNNHHLATARIESTASAPASSSAVNLQANLPSQAFGGPITVHGATAQDNTINVQVDATSTGAWRDLSQEGSTAAVTVPQNSARVLPDVSASRLRLQSTGSETADRDFEIWT